MKTLLMNFSVDKENKKIKVEREFAAPVEKVWEAWTDKNLLDRWWAPKPWQTKTKTRDFREGGSWLYAMVGPDSTAHWCRADYRSVQKLKGFSLQDAFCDENGKINTDFPSTKWDVSFSPNGETTMVHIELSYDSAEDLEKILALGFKEGFTMALENLDGIFNS